MTPRCGPPLTIRAMTRDDDAAMAGIIRTVMTEFGASGPGFAIHDPEVAAMFDAYARPGCTYFVVERDGEVVGGGGIAPLDGGPPGTCELRKMYFLAPARGHGMGGAMLARCLSAARDLGYRACYLETLTGMNAAQRLYEKFGFRRLSAPCGSTGHFGCDRWYSLDLTPPPSPPAAPTAARASGDEHPTALALSS